MDEIVRAALAKWPNVPHCHGWLAQDARGRWYLRDEAAQAAGPFPHVRGSLIEHAGLLAFIARNYDSDADGAWYFQNGPQRVYVDLEAAPFVWRLDGSVPCRVTGPDGRETAARSAWTDESGRLFLHTERGYGLVHSLDTALAADAIGRGQWALGELPFAQMPARFGYVLRPRPGGSGLEEAGPHAP